MWIGNKTNIDSDSVDVGVAVPSVSADFDAFMSTSMSMGGIEGEGTVGRSWT